MGMKICQIIECAVIIIFGTLYLHQTKKKRKATLEDEK